MILICYHQKHKEILERGKSTEDIDTSVYILRTNPSRIEDSDRQEFCIIMTDDAVHALLEQGAKILVYGTFDKKSTACLLRT